MVSWTDGHIFEKTIFGDPLPQIESIKKRGKEKYSRRLPRSHGVFSYFDFYFKMFAFHPTAPSVVAIFGCVPDQSRRCGCFLVMVPPLQSRFADITPTTTPVIVVLFVVSPFFLNLREEGKLTTKIRLKPVDNMRRG